MEIKEPDRELLCTSVKVIVGNECISYVVQDENDKPSTLEDIKELLLKRYKFFPSCMVITEYGLSGKVYRYGNYGNCWEQVGTTCGYA